MTGEKDVHTEHCCIRHWCKYGSPTCPVTLGTKVQSHPCEFCENDPSLAEIINQVYHSMDKYSFPEIDELIVTAVLERYFQLKDENGWI